MKNQYIIADHIKAIVFLIGDGVIPSGKGQGYILRKLMRRMFSACLDLSIDIRDKKFYQDIVQNVLDIYKSSYTDLIKFIDQIVDILDSESEKYFRAIARGEKEWIKVIKEKDLSGIENKIFDLYQTHGVPLELSYSILDQKNIKFDTSIVDGLINLHQVNSKTNSTSQFKSGLGEINQKTTRLHTATHLLHQSLRELFGNSNIVQKGSAITAQKARFDFSFDRKLDEKELILLQERVQQKINSASSVVKLTLNKIDAQKMGAIGLFGEKYGDLVTIYSIEDKHKNLISKEFCTGPHVNNTIEVGNFVIIKQKSIGSGLKRLEYDVS
jgi:alanyl-tRNA synthetase